MKQIFLFSLFFSLCFTIVAQRTDSFTAHLYLTQGLLDKADSTIDYVCTQEEYKNNFETWYHAGLIYYAVGGESTRPQSEFKNLDPNWAEKLRTAATQCYELRSKNFGKNIWVAPLTFHWKEDIKYIENIVNKSSHCSHGNKIYAGDFTMPGVGFSKQKKGRAEYEYRDAYDGTRIYEGLFYYTYKDGSVNGKNTDIVRGIYSNNRQVGVWMWRSYLFDYTHDIKSCLNYETMTINFDDNGVLNGKFSYKLDGYFKNTKNISGDFSNGKLTHLHYEELQGMPAKGDYSPSGKPIGVWMVNGYRIEFDNQGNLIKNWYIDQATGDKHTVSMGICDYPKKIYNYANQWWND